MNSVSSVAKTFLSLVALLCLGASSGAAEPVSFKRDIAPILQAKCVTCHGPDKVKGRYRVDSFEHLVEPGSSDYAAVTPGKPVDSLLFELVATDDSDDRMPQDADPLPAEQVALIKRWIEEGANFDAEDRAANLASIIPRGGHPAAPEVYPHPLPITALAFDPEGKILAASGYHEVTLWNPDSGELVRRVGDLPMRIHGLGFASDGKFLAVAGGAPGASGEVALVDLAGEGSTRVLATTRDSQLCLDISPDGKRLVVGGADNAIRIFSLPGGELEHLIEQHADWVRSVAFSADGKLVASASRDRSSRAYNAETGELLTTFYKHNVPVNGAVFQPDGAMIVSGGEDEALRIWKVEDGDEKKRLGGFRGGILAMARFGDAVLTASRDNEIRLHEFKDFKYVRSYRGNTDWIYALAVHEGRGLLASGSQNGQVRLWNLSDAKELASFVASPGISAAAR